MGKKVWKAVKWFLGICLFLTAVRARALAGASADMGAVFLEGSLPGEKTAEEILTQEAEQEKPVKACFWREEREAILSCEETGKSFPAKVLKSKGNPECLFQGTSLLAWRQEGCAVDQKTARELFGTVQAEGQYLWYEGKRYQVVQTLESPEPVMLCQSQGEGEGFPFLALEFEQGQSVSEGSGQFLMRYGLSGEIVEFTFLEALTANLLFLFPAAAAIRLCAGLFQEKRRMVQVFGILVATGTAFLIWKGFSFPETMIPSRWSDFSFWRSWWEQERSNLLRILGTALGEMHLIMVFRMVQSMVCSLAAFAAVS